MRANPFIKYLRFGFRQDRAPNLRREPKPRRIEPAKPTLETLENRCLLDSQMATALNIHTLAPPPFIEPTIPVLMWPNLRITYLGAGGGRYGPQQGQPDPQILPAFDVEMLKNNTADVATVDAFFRQWAVSNAPPPGAPVLPVLSDGTRPVATVF